MCNMTHCIDKALIRHYLFKWTNITDLWGINTEFVHYIQTLVVATELSSIQTVPWKLCEHA